MRGRLRIELHGLHTSVSRAATMGVVGDRARLLLIEHHFCQQRTRACAHVHPELPCALALSELELDRKTVHVVAACVLVHGRVALLVVDHTGTSAVGVAAGGRRDTKPHLRRRQPAQGDL